jgi:hypothetical protein
MATTVKEIIGSAYTLLNNASEEELDLAVALTQYGITLSEMQHELISGYRNPEIKRVTIEFTANSEQGDLPEDFKGDVVLLRFNNMTVPDVPPNMLDEYRLLNQQAVAFFMDGSEGPPTKKAALSFKIPGTLELWYEPRPDVEINHEGNSQIDDAFKFFMSVRLAFNLSKYVLYNDQRKEANKQLMIAGLLQQASYAKDLYIAAVNKFSNNSRPFTRMPYSAR